MKDKNAITEEQVVRTNETHENKDSKLKYLYPATEFGGGIWKSYFTQFIGMLYTDVYFISVALSGILEMVTQITSWFAGPIFGSIIDKVSFKKGKFWPWILIGSTCVTIINIIIFTIPALTDNAKNMGLFIFIMAIILAFSLQATDISMISIFPRLGKTAQDRTFLSSGRQVSKNLAQSIFGFLVPLMLVWFTAIGGSEASGWALTAVILGICGWIFYISFVVNLKNSELEKKISKEKSTTKKKVTLQVMIKSLITNKPLLVMFLFFVLYQTFMFFQKLSASYFFKYYFDDFAVTGFFASGSTLATVAGTLFGIFWVKFFKDSKRAFLAAGVGVITTLLVMNFVVSSVSAMIYIVFVIIQNFFGGIVVAILLPLFASASDYGALNSGIRTDGLNMSIYTLSIKVGITLSTAIRVALLASAGYNAALYVDGVMPTVEVLNQLKNLQTLYPLILAIICFALVFFFYPLNDKKMSEIRAELNAREVAVK